MFLNKSQSIHHIKEVVLTTIPSGASFTVWLTNINTILGTISAILGIIWLSYRIIIAHKEFKSKT